MKTFKNNKLNDELRKARNKYLPISIFDDAVYDIIDREAIGVYEMITRREFNYNDRKDSRFQGLVIEKAFGFYLNLRSVEWRHPGYVDGKYDRGDFEKNGIIYDIKGSPIHSNVCYNKRKMPIEYLIGAQIKNSYKSKEMLVNVYGIYDLIKYDTDTRIDKKTLRHIDAGLMAPELFNYQELLEHFIL